MHALFGGQCDRRASGSAFFVQALKKAASIDSRAAFPYTVIKLSLIEFQLGLIRSNNLGDCVFTGRDKLVPFHVNI